MILLFECFLPRWAGGPLQGWAPRLVDSPETVFLLQSIICGLYISLSWLFLNCCLCIFVFLFHCLSSHLFILHNLCPQPTSSLMDFWNSFPPLCFTTHTAVQISFFHQSFFCLDAFRPPPFSHCVSLHPFKLLQRHLKIDFECCAETFFLLLESRNQRKRQTKTKLKSKKMVHDDQYIRYYKQV